jgi:hypothetical protein
VTCAAGARFTVADVLRDHLHEVALDPVHLRVAAHILACRTGALGGHRYVCTACGRMRYGFHSCRDRHCPTCGSLDQALWAEAQLDHLLPVSYYHLVFTVPHCLNPFFFAKQRATALEALFAAASSALLDVGRDKVGGLIGALAVLHTWNQRLDEHVHLHFLVPGGALAGTGWRTRPRYLMPMRPVAVLFQARLLDALKALLALGELGAGRHSPRPLIERAWASPWVVFAKRPLAGPQQVINYFARYTRRIAISNRRILDYDGQTVTFSWRDREHGNVKRTRSVSGAQFCRLFLQHVLPPGFVRIRRYGVLANRSRHALARTRDALAVPAPPPRPPETRAAACFRIFAINPSVCPTCGQARLVPVAEWRATALSIATLLAAPTRAP